MAKTISAKELLDKKHGKKGTPEREAFSEKAFSYYFAEIIKARRKELKMSQEDLAEIVGKKRPYISRIENGEDIRLSNFALIAMALGLNIQISASN